MFIWNLKKNRKQWKTNNPQINKTKLNFINNSFLDKPQDAEEYLPWSVNNCKTLLSIYFVFPLPYFLFHFVMFASIKNARLYSFSVYFRFFVVSATFVMYTKIKCLHRIYYIKWMKFRMLNKKYALFSFLPTIILLVDLNRFFENYIF